MLIRVMNRYAVQQITEEDYTFGIYDTQDKVFIGGEIHSVRDANVICEWFNELMEGKND